MFFTWFSYNQPVLLTTNHFYPQPTMPAYIDFSSSLIGAYVMAIPPCVPYPCEVRTYTPVTTLTSPPASVLTPAPHSMLPTPVYETGETLARGGSEKVEATNHYLSLVKRERNSRGVSNFLALFFSVFTIESSLLAKALTLVPILTPRLALRLTLRLALRLALRLVPRLALRLCACWPLNEKDSFPFSSQFVLRQVWQSHRGRDKRQAL